MQAGREGRLNRIKQCVLAGAGNGSQSMALARSLGPLCVNATMHGLTPLDIVKSNRVDILKTLAAFVAGFAILCVVIVAFLPPPKGVINGPQTRTEIHLCYDVISYLEATRHKPLREIVGEAGTSGSLDAQLTSLINSNRDLLNPTAREFIRCSKDGSQLIDLWGRPLQVKWREGLAGSNYEFLKASTDSPVIIWSLGPDGENDFGRGDDVVFRENAQTPKLIQFYTPTKTELSMPNK